MVAAGELLEHATVFGHCYGTPRRPIDEAIAAGLSYRPPFRAPRNRLRDNPRHTRMAWSAGCKPALYPWYGIQVLQWPSFHLPFHA
jgi:hypothetical protein